MTFGQMGLVALGFYLVGLVLVAEIARRASKDSTPSDHFLAGRDLGVFVLFLTLYATAYSGNSLLGYPGKAYRSGFSFIMATGFMMSIIVVFHALVPRLRPVAVAEGFVTPGDWVRHRFAGEPGARALSLAVGILMCTALANFLLAQLQAMGHMTGRVTDGMISYEFGIVGLAFVILFYESRGGMRAVAWTDAAQGILMLGGLAALLWWLVGTAGGLSAITERVAEVRPSAVVVPDATVCANWFSSITLLGLGSVLYPQAIQRVFAARSGKVLTRSLAIMTFMPLTTTLVVTLIGVAAITRLNLDLGVASDEVTPLLLEQWAADGGGHTAGAILVFLGALAAIMSTADSCLLSLGSLAAGDLLGRSGRDPATTKLGKRLAAGILLLMVPLAMWGQLTLWRLIELKMELLVQCVPAFLLAMHWTRLRAWPTFWGICVGTGYATVMALLGTKALGGVHVGVIGLALNVTVAWLGSLATSPRASASS
ncbi:MAG: sodium:solute symporter family protein [Candidatus Binatia bacterium]|nr:sodium:solute symporter family protein [Candidatus Binatia bacterium]